MSNAPSQQVPRKKRAAARKPDSRPEPDATQSPSPRQVRLHRQRMRLMGDLLNAAVAELPKLPADADRAGHGAYLEILRQVFATLFGVTKALPPDVLTRVSRVVAEQRRAELDRWKLRAEPSAKSGKSGAGHGAGDAEATSRLADTVRRLYGVDLPEERESSQPR